MSTVVHALNLDSKFADGNLEFLRRKNYSFTTVIYLSKVAYVFNFALVSAKPNVEMFPFVKILRLARVARTDRSAAQYV